jgi:hypothetical protein
LSSLPSISAHDLLQDNRTIAGEDIENLLVNMVLEKKLPNNTNLKKTHFHAYLLGNGLNNSSFGTFQVTTYDLWNLKSYYPN